MGISTGMGDHGTTRLGSGREVFKDDLRVAAYGALDELNAAMGVACAKSDLKPALNDRIRRVQELLFRLGAELASVPDSTLLGEPEVIRLDTEIHGMESNLRPLKEFLIPGGASGAAELFLACTIARRAERAIISLHRAEPLRPTVLVFMNRLSDWLFLTARTARES